MKTSERGCIEYFVGLAGGLLPFFAGVVFELENGPFLNSMACTLGILHCGGDYFLLLDLLLYSLHRLVLAWLALLLIYHCTPTNKHSFSSQSLDLRIEPRPIRTARSIRISSLPPPTTNTLTSRLICSTRLPRPPPLE